MKKLAALCMALAVATFPLIGCADLKEEGAEVIRGKKFEAVKELGAVAREGVDAAQESGKAAVSEELAGDGGDDTEEDESY